MANEDLNPEETTGEPINSFEGEDILDASEQHAKFKEQVSDCSIPGTFPCAVCYSIKELKKYLDNADASLPADIAEENRGIALMLGIKNSDDAGYAKDRVTIMMVASAFEANGVRKIVRISNSVLGDNGFGHVNGKNHDSGSLWP